MKLKDVQYTTCPAGNSDWLIRADSISINTAHQTGIAHDARVEFFGVPLLRLPVISFPVGNARKSGFWFPASAPRPAAACRCPCPGTGTSRPQQDLTFTPTWYTARGIDLESDYRYLTHNSHGELLGNFLPDDDKTGQARSRWRFSDTTSLPGEWRLTLDGENVSDTRYFEDFAQGASDGASTTFLPRRPNWPGADANLHAGVLVRNFPDAGPGPAAGRPSRHRSAALLCPRRLELEGALPLRYGVDAEATRFRHPGEVQGWRLDAEPRISLDYSGAGYFFRPSAMLDAAGYYLRDTAPGHQRHAQPHAAAVQPRTLASPSRATPAATTSAASRWSHG